MHVGIAYAIWCGLGMILVLIAGIVLYKQTIDVTGILGIALILLGILVINLFSKYGKV